MPTIEERIGFKVGLILFTFSLTRPAIGVAQALRTRDFVIEGSVVDAKQAPVAGVELSLIEVPGTALTSASGQFRLVVQSAGRYSLRVRRIGYQARILEVVVSGPLTHLKPIVLQELPAILPQVTVEGKVPAPLFNLRFSWYVSGMGYHDANHEWDTHGASLSPNAFAIVKIISNEDAPVYWEWYESMNPRLVEAGVGAVACLRWNDATLSSAWVGWTDTVRLLSANGSTWRRRKNGLVHGPCIQGSPIQSYETILNAGPMRDGWLVAGIRLNGGFGLSVQSSAGGAPLELPLPAFLTDKESIKKAHFSSTRSGAIVAGATWPFSWILIDPNRGDSITSTPTRLPELQDSVRYAQWTALSVLDIGNGYVQSIISPRARDRLIVVYDVAGRPLYSTKLAGAPALLACDPERRRCIAIHYSSAGMGRGEIIEYQY